MEKLHPKTVINAVAPTRICDVGGWTDTHFAGHGAVFNVAIYPYVEVQLHVLDAAESDERVVVSVENYGESYTVDPAEKAFGKHPLIEAAIHAMQIPDDLSIKANIFSFAPPGASMGTSAAVSVALIGALKALGGGQLSPREAASIAHKIETDMLGLECGIQDQLASAYGGINMIHMDQYPEARISQVNPPAPVFWELEQRLLLVYIGNPHNSSAIHKMVIDDLGKHPENDSRLQRLRELAVEAQDALLDGDFNKLGMVFHQNTEVQRALHPKLVCDAFENIIGIASSFEAAGCKVNGAGGDGGSIAILTNGDMYQKRRLREALVDQGYQTLQVQLSPQGLRVW